MGLCSNYDSFFCVWRRITQLAELLFQTAASCLVESRSFSVPLGYVINHESAKRRSAAEPSAARSETNTVPAAALRTSPVTGGVYERVICTCVTVTGCLYEHQNFPVTGPRLYEVRWPVQYHPQNVANSTHHPPT